MNATPKPRLLVVIASTRPGRAGLPVGRWAHEAAGAHGRFDVELADLAEVNLPLLDEPKHPRFGDYQHAHTRAWSARVAAADAFLLVVPEYNYSAPPALLNALDYLYSEWLYKPAAFVSYGGIAGGTRSQQMLKLTLTALKIMPIPEAVLIPFVHKQLEGGRFQPNETQVQSVGTALDELSRWTEALRPLRAKP